MSTFGARLTTLRREHRQRVALEAKSIADSFIEEAERDIEKFVGVNRVTLVRCFEDPPRCAPKDIDAAVVKGLGLSGWGVKIETTFKSPTGHYHDPVDEPTRDVYSIEVKFTFT